MIDGGIRTSVVIGEKIYPSNLTFGELKESYFYKVPEEWQQIEFRDGEKTIARYRRNLKTGNFRLTTSRDTLMAYWWRKILKHDSKIEGGKIIINCKIEKR